MTEREKEARKATKEQERLEIRRGWKRMEAPGQVDALKEVAIY